MNSRLYIPALITLGLGILSGCGGSSSSEQAYLPTGLQRTLDITLQDGKPYVFSFIIASESTATIYTGTSPAASTAVTSRFAFLISRSILRWCWVAS